MKTKKIYIAGKVSGEKIHECTMKFGKVQKQLEALGLEVVNPLEVVNDWHAPWKEAMKLCIKALLDCDDVLFLQDYLSSKGAMMEYTIAKSLDMPRHFSVSAIQEKINSLKHT